jgi:hypothetical protein
MAKRPQNGTKLMYEEAIRQNIVKKDWQKLSEVMIGAEKVGVRKVLRKTGWVQVGRFEASKGNHPSAIVAFNSARVLDPHPSNILGWMYEEVEAFCGDFEGRFSRQDLLVLAQALERVRAFHSLHSKVPVDVQDKGKSIAHWIESRLSNAPLKEETPATHHVQHIYSALYPPMTIEEVRAEFARIVEPLIRERLERKPMPASSGGGKRPKDPDEKEEKPPEKEQKPKRRKRRRKRRG